MYSWDCLGLVSFFVFETFLKNLTIRVWYMQIYHCIEQSIHWHLLWKAARPCFSCLCLLNESMDRFCTWYSDYVVVPVLGISRLASPNAFVMNTSSSAIILLLNSILGRISPSSQIVSMHLNMIRASKSAVMILKPFCSPRLSCTAPKTWNSKNIFE